MFTNCLICGAKIHCYPSRIRKYCSIECRNIAYTQDPNRHRSKSDIHRKHLGEARKGKKYPYSRLPMHIKPCEYCGKNIDTNRSKGGFLRGSYKRRFCSLECWYNFIRAKPENHPTFKGGAEPYYGSNWLLQRRLCLKRDNYHCRSCGKSIRQTRLDVHHIKPRQRGQDWQKANALDNLVTLCVSCHGKAKSGSASYPLPLI